MSTRSNRQSVAIGVVIMIVAVLAMPLALGGYTGSLDKVSFSGVGTYHDSGGDMSVIFDDAASIGHGHFQEVMVDVDHVVMEIDPSLPGTTISASPTFSQRINGVFVSYHANSVTVWVKNQQEQKHWENFLQTTRDLKTVRNNKEIPYQKVFP